MNANKQANLLVYLNWKVEDKNAALEFLELICYCANSCLTATSTVCCAVAELLVRLADSQVCVFQILAAYLCYLYLYPICSSALDKISVLFLGYFTYWSNHEALCYWVISFFF